MIAKKEFWPIVQDLQSVHDDVQYLIRELQETATHLERVLYMRNRLKTKFCSVNQMMDAYPKDSHQQAHGCVGCIYLVYTFNVAETARNGLTLAWIQHYKWRADYLSEYKKQVYDSDKSGSETR